MSGVCGLVVLDEIVAAGRPWGHVVRRGEILRLVDLEGQQAVDFLCFDTADPGDRYSAANTIKVQGNIYIGNGTVLYSDRGEALFTIIADTCGRHDTIYGCCSEANNFLRYGVRGTPSCYGNFCEILARFRLDERSIVGNVNFFMSVPVVPDGSAGRQRRRRRRDLATRQLCRTARRARRARRPVELSADVQPLQRLQPNASPSGDLPALGGTRERLNGLAVLVRAITGP